MDRTTKTKVQDDIVLTTVVGLNQDTPRSMTTLVASWKFRRLGNHLSSHCLEENSGGFQPSGATLDAMSTKPRSWSALALGVLTVLGSLTGCATRPPEGIQVVPNFAIDRYLGTWYEIARLDHSFERGMSECRAEYSLRPDGSVNVLNSGWTGTRWKSATGRAVFAGEPTTPSLSVTFFWPFSGGYHVIALDPVAPGDRPH